MLNQANNNIYPELFLFPPHLVQYFLLCVCYRVAVAPTMIPAVGPISCDVTSSFDILNLILFMGE